MKLNQTTLALLLTLSAAGTILNPGAAQTNTLSGKADGFLTKQAARHADQGRTSVIVKTDGDLTPEQEARLKTLGADIYRHLPIIDSLALSLPSRNLDKLAALPFVQRMSADVTVKKCDEFTVQHTGADVAARQNAVDGSGVAIAVIDSGIYNASQDLTGKTNGSCRVIQWANFVPNAGPNDSCGHGTHVAGIIAGNGSGSTGSKFFRTFYGIAPKSNLVSIKVLDQNGAGTVSQVVSGIQWAINNTTTYNIRVMNLSVGHPVGESYVTDPLCQAVEKAWKAGIVVVCAAGNEGRTSAAQTPGIDNEGYGTNYGSIQSPGNDPYVITVGAMKQDLSTAAAGTYTGNRSYDRVATYSSRGPSRLDLVLKPDIVAPGNKIISLGANKSYLYTTYGGSNVVTWSDYSTYNPNGNSAQYFRLSGTSMAAPVVSGAAALLLQKYPTLTPDTIKARLMLSADKWAQPDGTMDPCTFGAGYLNIPAALACTAVPNQAATSPSMSVDANGNVYINMDRAVWGTDVNGQRAVWGVSSVNDLRAVWGTRAIWGSSANILNASRAVWGTSVWSDRAVWGTSSSAADLTSTAIYGE